jgi:putative ABC transport system permease protein
MPNWTQEIESRLANLKLTPGREAEIVEELAEHLEERYAELRAEGLDEAAALALVREELRDDPGLAERMRPLRQANTPPPVAVGGPRSDLLADFWQDLRLATRMLRKQSALTFVVVLTLAIGIGANGALFALVDRVLLRDLPLPEPDRLVTIWERTETTPQSRVSPNNYVDWLQRNESFQAIGAVIPNTGSMVMTTETGAEPVPRQWVTMGIFDALGIAPVAGRTFTPTDETSGVNVTVISEAFWRNRFGGDPGIVGQASASTATHTRSSASFRIKLSCWRRSACGRHTACKACRSGCGATTSYRPWRGSSPVSRWRRPATTFRESPRISRASIPRRIRVAA